MGFCKACEDPLSTKDGDHRKCKSCRTAYRGKDKLLSLIRGRSLGRMPFLREEVPSRKEVLPLRN